MGRARPDPRPPPAARSGSRGPALAHDSRASPLAGARPALPSCRAAASATGGAVPEACVARIRGADRSSSTALLAAAGCDRRDVAVLAECADKGIELGDGLCPLTPGQLNLVGQLLELLEGRLLIEWLGLGRVCHVMSS